VFKVVELDVDTKRFVNETEFGNEVTSTALHICIDEWNYRKNTYRSNDTGQTTWNRICSILSEVRTALDGPVESFIKFLDEIELP
jgi:hypothetical protein